MLGYGWPPDDEHPDGPLPLSCHAAGRGAMLVGDPRWWRTHDAIRLQPSADDPVERDESG